MFEFGVGAATAPKVVAAVTGLVSSWLVVAQITIDGPGSVAWTIGGITVPLGAVLWLYRSYLGALAKADEYKDRRIEALEVENDRLLARAEVVAARVDALEVALNAERDRRAVLERVLLSHGWEVPGGSEGGG